MAQRKNNEISPELTQWKRFYKRNIYYHENIQKLAKHLIPQNVSVIQFSSKSGELLKALPNKKKMGIEDALYHSKKDTSVQFAAKTPNRKYDYVILDDTLATKEDILEFLDNLQKVSNTNTRIVVFSFNYIWKPVFDLAEKVGLKLPPTRELNWLSPNDIEGFFALQNFEVVKQGKRILIPFAIPIVSNFINRYIAPLPLINHLCLMNFAMYRPIGVTKDYSVSIIIPARNEAGNMKGVLSKIPILGKKTEVVFVEGNSKDDTYDVIKNEIKRYKGPIQASLYKQKGKGKGDAVRLGFAKAKNELLMILDADLTVPPKELSRFYKAIASGKADFIMGSRLVYPMEKLAMRTLNVLGNKFFSLVFSFLLDQKIRDTLCGTKVLLKNDYKKIEKNRYVFGDFDPFGDYDLIFGAAKLNLKIMEIPIRYKERTYGTTNISRFTHGFLLLQMVFFAARKLKFV